MFGVCDEMTCYDLTPASVHQCVDLPLGKWTSTLALIHEVTISGLVHTQKQLWLLLPAKKGHGLGAACSFLYRQQCVWRQGVTRLLHIVKTIASADECTI